MRTALTTNFKKKVKNEKWVSEGIIQKTHIK